jgi:hypothetical protein
MQLSKCERTALKLEEALEEVSKDNHQDKKAIDSRLEEERIAQESHREKLKRSLESEYFNQTDIKSL